MAKFDYQRNRFCNSGIMAFYLQKLLSKLLVRAPTFIPFDQSFPTNLFQTINKQTMDVEVDS